MHVFLVGYFGFSNVGDDICLQKSKALIRTRYPNATYSYLGAKQSGHSISRFSFFAVIKAIYNADYVIFAGGSLLQNASSTASLYYYLSLIVLSKILRKKVELLAQGIGPVYGALNKLFLALALRMVDEISVRDSKSFEYVSSIKSCTLTTDLAFYDAAIHDNAFQSVISIGVNYANVSSNQSLLQSVTACLKSQELPVQPYSFFHELDDAVLSNHGFLDSYQITASRFYDACDKPLSLLVAMRYHSCVWAALHGIPFIALAYDPKVLEIAKAFGQPYLCLYDKEDQSFDTLFQDMTQHYASYKKALLVALNKQLNTAKNMK